MLSIQETNMLKAQNEGLIKQNKELQAENRQLQAKLKELEPQWQPFVDELNRRMD